MENPVKFMLSDAIFKERKFIETGKLYKVCGVCSGSIIKGTSYFQVTFSRDNKDVIKCICAKCSKKYRDELVEMEQGIYNKSETFVVSENIMIKE